MAKKITAKKTTTKKTKRVVEAEKRPDPITSKTSTRTRLGTSTSQAENSQDTTDATTVPATTRTSTPLAGLIKKAIAKETGDTAPHVCVNAKAGTGKTTSMVEGMKDVKGLTTRITPSDQQEAIWKQLRLGKSDSIRFNAFGKAIADTLSARMKEDGLDRLGCEASTFHSMGNQAVRKMFGYQDPVGYSVQNHTAKLLGEDYRDLKKKGKATLLKSVAELVSLCKQNLMGGSEEELDELSSHYDVEMSDSRQEVYGLVPQVLESCKQPNGKIAFDDMVWLPVVLDLPIARADMLLVDEAQDLNRMQQELAYKAGHRIVFVGDPNQAIFGFAGADAESMERMKKHLGGESVVDEYGNLQSNPGRGCVELPLTVTRRCGKAIVELARQYVPEFEAHESNPAGIIREAAYSEKTMGAGRGIYTDSVQDEDMVLCRVNAPLVNQVFKLLKLGRKAVMLGRNIGEGLITLIGKVLKTDEPKESRTSVAVFVGLLDDWLAAEIAKEEAKRFPSESKVASLQDRHDCISAFSEGAQYVSDIVRKIHSVFADKQCPSCWKTYQIQEQVCGNPQCRGRALVLPKGIKFSSIHRAKGLESKRVYILEPQIAQVNTSKMKAWELQQERNLKYVAMTRAIEELIYVS